MAESTYKNKESGLEVSDTATTVKHSERTVDYVANAVERAVPLTIGSRDPLDRHTPSNKWEYSRTSSTPAPPNPIPP